MTPPTPGEDFPSIIAAARQGAEWAWTAIYRALAPPVLGYLRARGAADPEDLMGEVFVHLVRGLARFEGDEPAFRSWTFLIAHHRLLDERRRLVVRPDEPCSHEAMVSHGPNGNVEEEAIDGLSTGRVRRVIDALSPDQREVMVLRIIASLTLEEVARALGKSPEAVKALQHRGLEQIRKEISRIPVSVSAPHTVTRARWDALRA
ncbi:MAG: RNA polymerase sigma factor [Actinomycetota bacterium]